MYLALIILFNVAFIAAMQIFYTEPEPNLKLEKLRLSYVQPSQPVVDHSTFPELQKSFSSPGEVTEACIGCHTERHKEVLNSSHFKWERVSYMEGQGITALGKRNVMNNFCIGTQGNEQACSSCHTGYGMTSSKTFNFQDPKNVDCLSCHTQDLNYRKKPGDAGLPAAGVDLTQAAMNVANPEMNNCGSCHFYGGGGNNVKHGDLEEALFTATRDIDVHMGVNGINLTCTDCHTAENHQIKGKMYSVSSANVNRLLCEDCHSNTPHLNDMLNTHTAKVACQTCHIPEYAKVNPTKQEWYWSKAGDLKDGKPYVEENEEGEHVYMSIKGKFKWGKNLVPEYAWFNGTADHYLIGDKIDTTGGPVPINRLLGSHDDPGSKIIPVKVHRGNQIFDKQYLTLIQPKLYAKVEGDSAFWKDFDWDKAASAGMKNIGLPYSGQYGFTQTEMTWPLNHMVAPANMSLSCQSCHQRENGRLAKLTGFYLPGRDYSPTLDTLGHWLILLSIAGVLIHGSIRIIHYFRSGVTLEMKDYKEFDDE